jgi:hypothetical protein
MSKAKRRPPKRKAPKKRTPAEESPVAGLRRFLAGTEWKPKKCAA